MSTIQKLDPMVRERRTQRKNLLAFFEKQRRTDTEVGKFCITSWAHMVAIRDDPGSDGFRKHALAMRLHERFSKIIEAQSAPETVGNEGWGNPGYGAS
jgi:hypothetical protein